MRMIQLFLSILGALIAQKSFANDPFFPKQWALSNTGQAFQRDIDDIHAEDILGIAGFDIGLAGAIWPKDPVIVAVIDSGIDFDHPDLKDRIYKNLSECTPEGRLVPLNPTDRDGNGYPGDCMGYDFIKQGGQAHKPYDDTGHGTHIAGILSAAINNEIGIRGISDSIKIMPLRVIGKNTRHVVGGIKITAIFAKAIRYAVDQGAHVINMSLGWPVALDTKDIRDAIAYANAKHVPIIAAAGNNATQTPVYPCAHPGVLCVAAASPNGLLAPFSNYGASADVLAPGDQILSTFPLRLHSDIFNIEGYEIKNGTSQAAPYVAGLAALLKATYKSASTAEIYGRILGTAKTLPHSDSRLRMISYQEALKAPLKPFLVPQLKGSEVLTFEGETAAIVIPIENLGAQSEPTTITVTTQDPHVKIATAQVSIPALATGAKFPLNLSLTIGMQADQRVYLTFHLGERTYTKRFLLGRDARSMATLISPIQGTEEELRLLYDKDKQLRLLSLKDPGERAPLSYFLVDMAQNNLTIRILQRTGHNIRFTNTLLIPETERFIGIEVVEDISHTFPYLFRVKTQGSDTQGKFIQYALFRPTGESFLGGKTLRQYPKYAVAEGEGIWQKLSVPGLPALEVPVFIAVGKTPAADLVEDGWSTPSNPTIPHAYQLYPVLKDGRITLEERIFDHQSMILQLRQSLNLDYNDLIEPVAIWPLGMSEVSILFSVGREFERIAVKANFKQRVFTGATSFGDYDLPFNGMSISKTLSTDTGKPLSHELLFLGYPTDTSLRLIGIDKDHGTVLTNTSFRNPLPRDLMFGHLAHFKGDMGSEHYLHTKNHVFYLNGTRTLYDDIDRFSFLPGLTLLDSHTPLIMTLEGQKTTGLLVDHTAISQSLIYVITPLDGSLKRPVSLSMTIPNGCQPLNPRIFGKRTFQVFSCPEFDSAILHFVPLGQP